MRAPKDMHHTFSDECDEDFLLLSDNKLQQKKSFERDMGRFKGEDFTCLERRLTLIEDNCRQRIHSVTSYDIRVQYCFGTS
jgi:hypothetical protein